MVLPYTEAVFYSFLSRYHGDLWPVQPAVLALVLLAVALVLRPAVFGDRFGARLGGPTADRSVGLLLAAAWAWVGLGFYGLEFSRLHFLAPLYAGVFVLQGLLLAVTAGFLGKLRFGVGSGSSGGKGKAAKAGLVLVVLALVGYPLADAIFGPGWAAARLPGLAPGPTVLLTLGLLLQARGRAPYHLVAVPLLWCLVTAATAWGLGMGQDVVLAVCGVGGAVLVPFMGRTDRELEA